jgi:ParB family transcriptional regulator, chromosome partitioning protein
MAKGLGKGLNVFFPEETKTTEQEVKKISINKLVANPYQPRKVFDEETLMELKESITEHGVLQPIIVRAMGKKYEIVAGERRFRASQLAGLTEVPAIIKDMNEQQMMELAILENLQREDLTPIEEAEAYEQLIQNLGFKQEELAKRLGKSRPHIANHIRLLQLPEEVRGFVNNGQLSMGHGRTLLGLKNKRQIPDIARKVIAQQLNVRQLEALVQQLNSGVSRETKEPKKDVFVAATETHLRDYFGTNVQIKKTKDKGKIEIEFYSAEDLERILDILNVEID